MTEKHVEAMAEIKAAVKEAERGDTVFAIVRAIFRTIAATPEHHELSSEHIIMALTTAAKAYLASISDDEAHFQSMLAHLARTSTDSPTRAEWLSLNSP